MDVPLAKPKTGLMINPLNLKNKGYGVNFGLEFDAGGQKRVLVDHGHKLGFDDAWVRSQQTQPVDTRGCNDCSIGRVPQTTPQRGDLQRDFVCQRKEAEQWVGL